MQKTANDRATKAKGDPETAIFIQWIDKGLQKPGKSLRGMASAIGRAYPQAYKIARGSRKLIASELAAISFYLGEPVPRIGISDAAQGAPVVMQIGDGTWFEKPIFDDLPLDGEIVPMMNGMFREAQHYAARVANGSMEPTFPRGSYAIFVPYAQVRPEPKSGDYVAVELRQGQLYKPAILQMTADGKGWILASKRGVKTILHLDGKLQCKDRDKQVEIRGLVVGNYRMVLASGNNDN